MAGLFFRSRTQSLFQPVPEPVEKIHGCLAPATATPTAVRCSTAAATAYTGAVQSSVAPTLGTFTSTAGTPPRRTATAVSVNSFVVLQNDLNI